MLTHENLIQQLDYDQFTGLLTWKISKYSVRKGDIAGCKQHEGYIIVQIDGKQYRAHRLAYFHYHGYMPEGEIDHWDQIEDHNWISNLREASPQCQRRNTRTPDNNTTGVKGVYWNKQEQKWKASIGLNSKIKHLGYYFDFDDAVCARLAGEQCLNWSGCDSNSPAYLYVKNNIQKENLK